MPSLGANWKIGENATFGVSAYGNGGMNTNYAAPVFGVAPAGVDLSQMFLAPTYAHKLGPRHARRRERDPRLPALRGEGPPGLRSLLERRRATSRTTSTRTPTAPASGSATWAS